MKTNLLEIKLFLDGKNSVWVEKKTPLNLGSGVGKIFSDEFILDLGYKPK